MLKLKAVFLFCLFAINSYAIEVVVASQNIGFKDKITAYNVSLYKVKEVKKNCDPVSVETLKKDVHIATHYIKAGSILCKNDVKKYVKETVLVKFGSIEIETDGKLIYENDEYIRIKKNDGKIEKIYKDGRVK